MKMFLLMMIMIISACSNTPPIESKDEVTKLNQFFEKAFQDGVDRSPQTQTYLGIKKDYGQLNDISEENNEKEFRITKKLLSDLKEFNFDKLDASSKMSYLLFKESLESEIDNHEYRRHYFPVNQMFGMHADLPAFMINMHLIDNKSDAEAYVSRIKLFKRQFDQLIIKLETQRKLKIIAPQFVYPKAIQDSINMISGSPFDKSKIKNPIWVDFNEKIKKLKLSSSEQNKLNNDLKEALLSSLKPAYEELITKLQELEKIAPLEAPASSLPDGDDFYKAMLFNHTTTHMTADEIHELGLKETKRIHEEMKIIMGKVKFKGDFKEFLKFMKTSKQFTFRNTKNGKDQYLRESRRIIERMKKRLPEMFGILPKAPLIVKAVEPFREASAGLAFYESPSENGTRPGIYFVNLYDMNAVTKYEMEALAYHEAIPGHHMQIAISTELTNLPRFRRYSHYTAYTEGWGLYAENFPKDYGFYKDPFSDFGRLAMELWRAARLVVDTGLHAKNWKMDQAIKWLDDNTSSPNEENVRAIQRYIVMPGQATAYKVGMNKIIELKTYAQNQLGAKFDIRKFHDEVLKDGSLPLNILEKKIYLWVDSYK